MEDKNRRLQDNLIQMTRLALKGDKREIDAFSRRMVRSLKGLFPELSDDLARLVAANSSVTAATPLRDTIPQAIPVDAESRLHLLRHEYPVVVETDPILSLAAREAIEQIIEEHTKLSILKENLLHPTNTALFVGPPGVGKTFSARWIASRLRKPLLTLDLSTVMSSFLGKTGANIRSVLDYAKRADAVLLLDEFDSIAKRRNDETEVGELKRLVTVLLQEIDLWPEDRLMIAASNHQELLDPAIWRRFKVKVDFSMPDPAIIKRISEIKLNLDASSPIPSLLAAIWTGRSHSDAVLMLERAQRKAALRNTPILDVLIELIEQDITQLPLKRRKAVGLMLKQTDLSERMISKITGLARGTIRKIPFKEANSSG